MRYCEAMQKLARGAFLALCVLIAGCAPQNRVTVRAVQESIADSPVLSTSVYLSEDGNTADIYLTDLDAAALDPGAPLAGLSGRLVHMHLFLTPKPGSTPIAASACSVTARYIIIAEGQVGVYAGGGFLQPRSSLGEPTYVATVSEATLRLSAKTPGFKDRLGPAMLEARIAAERNEPAAKRIGARVAELVGIAGRSESEAK
jgi:hypothetical protein